MLEFIRHDGIQYSGSRGCMTDWKCCKTCIFFVKKDVIFSVDLIFGQGKGCTYYESVWSKYKCWHHFREIRPFGTPELNKEDVASNEGWYIHYSPQEFQKSRKMLPLKKSQSNFSIPDDYQGETGNMQKHDLYTQWLTCEFHPPLHPRT